jgi:hypothetical protein
MHKRHRTSRLDYFESRCGKPVKIPAETQQLRKDRLAKRFLKSKGIIGSKIPYMWQAETGEKVVAYTKSEARSLIKKNLQVRHLPVGFKLERISLIEGADE